MSRQGRCGKVGFLAYLPFFYKTVSAFYLGGLAVDEFMLVLIMFLEGTGVKFEDYFNGN